MTSAMKILLIALPAISSIAASSKPAQRPSPRAPTALQRIASLEARVETLATRIDALERCPPPQPKQPRAGEPQKARRCEGMASSTGKRCRARALAGSRFCTWHDDDPAQSEDR